MPHTITITPDAGVYRASLDGSPDVTAAGDTEADALAALAHRIQEHGWDWSKPTPTPTPLTPSETDENPAQS